MKALFSPSLMCMDFLEIKRQTQILNSRCDCFHVDIMDGHYVKNITLSPCIIEAIKKVAQKPLECHLMVTDPESYVQPLKAAGADMVAFHVETVSAQAFRIINSIKMQDAESERFLIRQLRFQPHSITCICSIKLQS